MNAKSSEAVAEERVVDVVCNMPVDPKTALKTEYQGKTYYFCQPDCKNNFEGSPGSYTAAKPSHHSVQVKSANGSVSESLIAS